MIITSLPLYKITVAIQIKSPQFSDGKILHNSITKCTVSHDTIALIILPDRQRIFYDESIQLV
jgi:hypothetical protein